MDGAIIKKNFLKNLLKYKRNSLPIILLILSMSYIITMGIMSTDFGRHWDEFKITKSVQTSVQTGLFLPRWYNYPSICYDIAMLIAAPNLVSHKIREYITNENQSTTELINYLGSSIFNLELRKVFLVLSALSGLVIYLLTWKISGNRWISLFASLAFTTSWEFTYHAKWIAPDCLLALFIVCSLCAQYGIFQSQTRHKLFLMIIISSIFAGLSISTKYTGSIVIVPLSLAIMLTSKQFNMKIVESFYLTIFGFLIVILIFLLTTPGSILEPLQFVSDVFYESHHYSSGHLGHTVSNGWDHLSKMLIYLASLSLSKNTIFAVIMSILSLLGIMFIIKTGTRITIWFLSLPFFYIIFMSLQKVMFVRNYIILILFLAILSALGFLFVISLTKNRILRLFLYNIPVIFIIFNLFIITKSSISIISPGSISIQSELKEHIGSSLNVKYYLSLESRKCVGSDSIKYYTNIVGSIKLADKVIFFSNEIGISGRDPRALFLANVPGRYLTIWNYLEEVNWNYYPSWSGHYRLLEISSGDEELKRLIEEVILTNDSTRNKNTVALS